MDTTRNGHSRILDASGRPFEFVPTRDYTPPDNGPWDEFALSHVFSFAGLVSGAWRTYLQTGWDEAMRKSREAAQILRRDCFLMSLLDERREAVCGLKWHIECDDEEDPVQKCVKDTVQEIVERTPRLNWLKMTLLNAVWWGRYAVEVRWRWQECQGQRQLHLANFIPLNGDKIGHTFDHTPFINVNASYKDQISGGEFIQSQLGPALLLKSRSWRERFIIHAHDVGEDPDFFEADTGEMIHGLGVRDRVFFYQWLKLEWVAAVSDWIQRQGLGTNVWGYDVSNSQSLIEVRKQARDFSNKINLFMPLSADQRGKAIGSFERIPTPMDGVQVVYELLIPYIDRALERYIVGQSMSGGADKEDGLGGTGRAEFAAGTKHNKIRLDAENLDETLTGDDEHPSLVSTIFRYTFPELYGTFGLRHKSDLDDPKSKEKLDAVQVFCGLGGEVVENEARALTGLSDPKPGDQVIGGKETMGMGEGKGPDGKPTGPGGKPEDGGPPQGRPEAEGEEKDKSDFHRYERQPGDEPEEEGGHWVTIGAKAGHDGKKHGGTPVFIKGGKVVKGHKSLTGLRVEPFKEPEAPAEPEPAAPESAATHRGQLAQSKEHHRTVWGHKAKTEGLDPRHLHSLAAEIVAHDAAFKKDATKMLQEARRVSKAMGFDLKTVAANAARGQQDHTMLHRFDEVAEEIATGYPELLGSDPGQAEERLYQYILEGNPEPMAEEEAYAQAFDLLQEARAREKEGGGEDFKFGANAPAKGDVIPFGRLGYFIPYNTTDAAGHEHRGPGEGGGQFTGAGGAAGGTAKPSRAERQAARQAAKASRQAARKELIAEVRQHAGHGPGKPGDTFRDISQDEKLRNRLTELADNANDLAKKPGVSLRDKAYAFDEVARAARRTAARMHATQAGGGTDKAPFGSAYGAAGGNLNTLRQGAREAEAIAAALRAMGAARKRASRRAKPPTPYAGDTGHWVTIGGHPGKEGKHEGGTHVLIDAEGNILGGPEWLKEKGVTKLKEGMPEKKEAEEPAAKEAATAAPEKFPPADPQAVAKKWGGSAAAAEAKPEPEAPAAGYLPRGPTPEEIAASAQAAFGPWWNGLPQDERAAIKEYKGNGYTKINGLLRGKHTPPNDAKKKALEEKVARIDAALAKSKLDKDTLAFRGMKSPKMVAAFDKLKGAVITDKGFVSTSFNRETLEDYEFGTGKSGISMEVRLPAGSAGGYIDFAGIKEYEWLLPRGSRFKVVDTREEGGRKVAVVELTQEKETFKAFMRAGEFTPYAADPEPTPAPAPPPKPKPGKFTWEEDDVEITFPDQDESEPKESTPYAFDEALHPRGQPENAGQFGPGGGSSGGAAAAPQPAAGAAGGPAGGRVSNHPDTYQEKFHAGGSDYVVLANRHDEAKDAWELFFSSSKGGDETLKATGDQGAAAVGVMRQIGRSVEGFLAAKHPRQLQFEAARGEKSRIKLYDHLAKKLAQKHGYGLNRRKGWFGGVTYTLTKAAPPQPPGPAEPS